MEDFRPDAPKNSTQFVIGEWTKFRSDSVDDDDQEALEVRSEGLAMYRVYSVQVVYVCVAMHHVCSY